MEGMKFNGPKFSFEEAHVGERAAANDNEFDKEARIQALRKEIAAVESGEGESAFGRVVERGTETYSADTERETQLRTLEAELRTLEGGDTVKDDISSPEPEPEVDTPEEAGSSQEQEPEPETEPSYVDLYERGGEENQSSSTEEGSSDVPKEFGNEGYLAMQEAQSVGVEVESQVEQVPLKIEEATSFEELKSAVDTVPGIPRGFANYDEKDPSTYGPYGADGYNWLIGEIEAETRRGTTEFIDKLNSIRKKSMVAAQIADKLEAIFAGEAERPAVVEAREPVNSYDVLAAVRDGSLDELEAELEPAPEEEEVPEEAVEEASDAVSWDEVDADDPMSVMQAGQVTGFTEAEPAAEEGDEVVDEPSQSAYEVMQAAQREVQMTEDFNTLLDAGTLKMEREGRFSFEWFIKKHPKEASDFLQLSKTSGYTNILKRSIYVNFGRKKTGDTELIGTYEDKEKTIEIKLNNDNDIFFRTTLHVKKGEEAA